MECDVTAYAPSARHMTHLTMIEPYRADLLGFFTDLAKGVDHSRWRAEHAEMSAEAVAKGDRYRLDIAILGPPPLSRDDRLSLSVTRWECRRFARDLKRFLRGDDPLRITDEQ